MGQSCTKDEAYRLASDSIRHCRSDAIWSSEPFSATQEFELFQRAQYKGGTVVFTPSTLWHAYSIYIDFAESRRLENVRHHQGFLDGFLVGMSCATFVFVAGIGVQFNRANAAPNGISHFV
jgi:hypothetical protein